MTIIIYRQTKGASLMPRPKRPRCVLSGPIISEFKPEGFELKGETTLSLEEFEAIRHIDYEGLDQSQAAEIMNVSRQTVGRILRSGRYTLSSALVNGLRLKVEGGCYTMGGVRHGHGPHGHRRRHGRQGCRQGTGQGQSSGNGPGWGKKS